MIPKIQIKQDLQLSLSKLETLISSAGLPNKDTFTEEEYQQILEAHTRPKEPKKPKEQMDLSAQGGISFIQSAVESAANEGRAIAQKRVMARFSAMVNTENQLMQQGFQFLSSLDDQINAYEIEWAPKEGEGGMENFLAHLFPGCTPKALPSKE